MARSFASVRPFDSLPPEHISTLYIHIWTRSVMVDDTKCVDATSFSDEWWIIPGPNSECDFIPFLEMNNRVDKLNSFRSGWLL